MLLVVFSLQANDAALHAAVAWTECVPSHVVPSLCASLRLSRRTVNSFFLSFQRTLSDSLDALALSCAAPRYV